MARYVRQYHNICSFRAIASMKQIFWFEKSFNIKAGFICDFWAACILPFSSCNIKYIRKFKRHKTHHGMHALEVVSDSWDISSNESKTSLSAVSCDYINIPLTRTVCDISWFSSQPTVYSLQLAERTKSHITYRQIERDFLYLWACVINFIHILNRWEVISCLLLICCKSISSYNLRLYNW